jgi:hypothetical protein
MAALVAEDVAVVRGEHGGEKGFGCVPVGEDVDVEDFAQKLIGSIQDGVRCKYTRVVDEDTRCTQGRLDFLCCGIYGFWVCDIALEMFDMSI